MFHQSANEKLLLSGSHHWRLVVDQVNLSIGQGVSAGDIYHNMDRMPDKIREELHKVLKEKGMVVNNPVFRKHINPMGMFQSEGCDVKPVKLVYRSPTDEAPMSKEPSYTEVVAKGAFSNGFSKASGLSAFEKMFMAAPLATPHDGEADGSVFNDIPGAEESTGSASQFLQESKAYLGIN